MQSVINMKKIILFTIFWCTITVAQAQRFSWGYPFSMPNETEKEITHIVDGNLYRISDQYDHNIFNHIITADRFSTTDFEKEATVDLSVEQPPMGLASLTFNSMFQKEGTLFSFFYIEYDRKTKSNKLLYREVDIRSGNMGTLHTVAGVKGKNSVFQVAQSPNGAYFSVLIEKPFQKKSHERIKLLLLDTEKAIIAEKEYEFPLEDNRRKQHDMFVSDSGKVFFVKKIEEKKVKPYLNLYLWNPDSGEVVTESLKQEDNYQMYQFEGVFHQGDFYLLGLLTHEKSSNFGLKIDLNGRHSGTRGSSLAVLKISPEGKVVYNVRNDFKSVISNLNFNSVLIEDKAIWVVQDRMYTEKKSVGGNIAQGNLTYDYKYLNNGFFVNHINPQTGKMDWKMKIDTAEPNTINDNGDYLSALPLLKDGNLVLLYNETRDLNKGVIHNIFNRRFPIMHIISNKGETVSRSALMAAGIGVTKEEEFELNTSVLVPTDDNKYILRARNQAEYKYGVMSW